MKPTDDDTLAVTLARLREWTRNPHKSNATLDEVARWVDALFRRCLELADMTPRFLEMQEEVRSLEAAIRCHQKEYIRLRTLLNDKTKAPWELAAPFNLNGIDVEGLAEPRRVECRPSSSSLLIGGLSFQPLWNESGARVRGSDDRRRVSPARGRYAEHATEDDI